MTRADDDAFLAAFESATLPSFHHRDHIKVAWLYLRRDGSARGGERMIAGIRHFAAAAGKPDLYHDTLTRAWLALVQRAIEREPEIDEFDAFLSAHPALADKNRLLTHYAAATLASPQAKAGWVEPDLAPLT